MRFWKSELRAVTLVRAVFKTGTGRHAGAYDLGGGGPGCLFGNYADVPSGQGTLEIYADPEKKPVSSRPLDLVADSYLTLLVSEPEKSGAPPRVEIIANDAAADPAVAQITVRSFIADLKEMRVTVGDSLNAQFVTGSSFLQMRGLKPGFYPVRTVGTGPNDKPFEWNTEVDLRQHLRQTLLVYPDPYGRIRPRLTVDGELQPPPPSDSGDGQR